MKRFLRSQFESRFPGLFNGIRAVRNRRYFRRMFSEFQASVEMELFPKGKPTVVQTGPFRGLRYFNETVWGSITPRWLGSYEAELHPILFGIIGHGYQTIIDVGCAEGYYAVGLAVAISAPTVVACDTDFISRNQVSRLARLNGVAGRIVIKSSCDFELLEALSNGKTLVVCDIEGGEAHLLDPDKARSLTRNDILVEVHESSQASREIEELLRSRFGASHRIERIAAIERGHWIDEYTKNVCDPLPRALLTKATEEHRTQGQVWLWMQANSC